MTKEFQQHVYLNFQVYNSLFLTLPFGDTSRTGVMLPLLGMQSARDLEEGKNPSDILNAFFKEHLHGASDEEKVSALFAFIKYVERQVVLFDAVEDAAFQYVHRLDGPGTLRAEITRMDFGERYDEMVNKLNDFSLRVVMTAHPTQFYPGRILSIISDLDRAIRANSVSQINELLSQLGKTPMVQKIKPTPFTEAVRLIWYLENVFYKAITELSMDIARGLNVDQASLPLESLLRVGFWPGGDRDGNPFVSAETTFNVAVRLRRTIMICYYRDLRELKRKLTYKNVYHRMNDIGGKLSTSIADREKGYLNVSEFLSDLTNVRDELVSQNLNLAIEYIDALISKVRIFGFHFTTIDIRQDSSIIDAVIERVMHHTNRYEEWSVSDEAHKLEILQSIDLDPKKMEIDDPVERDVFESMAVMHSVVDMNGERACERYIISNCQSKLHVMQVFHLMRWTLGSVPFNIVPLFETVDDLANAPDIMHRLYNGEVYGPHIRKMHSRQSCMLGFSDGTKDGGYMQSNWSIYRAKEEITKVSRTNSVHVVFFDGRGGPPARGGGKSNKFYSSLGSTIEDKEIQLTIQGQTISSNFGTDTSARYNIEQLLSAGLENSVFSEGAVDLDEDAREILSTIASSSYECYKALKNDEDFLPYLEQMGTLPYYGMTNIGSRPVKRKGSAKLTLKSLRAIPFVGSWNQMKQNVPGYYGLGTALKLFKDRGEISRVADLYKRSLFFRTLIENSMMALTKCYFPLTQYMSTHERFGRLWNMIHDEYVLTKELLLEISGQKVLLETASNARDSIKLREQLVLPILVVQQHALQRIRQLEREGKDAQTYHTMVMRTMFAIINAGRNSA